MRLNCWYNPIKYIDPDGRDFGVDEFNPPPPGGENPPEVPGCPECDPGSIVLQGVLVTAYRPFMKEDVESITTLFRELAEAKEREQAQYEANLAHKATGSCTLANDELNLIPYEKLAAGIFSISKAAAIIVTGIKWGKPLGKVTYAGAKSNVLLSTSRQLQAKFKHAADFGILGNYSKGNASKFSSAINRHINSAGVQAIQGTYRGQPVIHYLNPNTGLDVISSPLGHFISGWQLNPAQLQNVLKHGGL